MAAKREITISLSMPFYPIERPWTSDALLVAANVDREAYLAALAREVLGAAPDYGDCCIGAVYAGGGIATHMADASLGTLLGDCRRSYDMTRADGSPSEITLRAHPGMVAAATLDACRTGKVTRLVLECATFSAEQARELGRFLCGPEAMAVTQQVLAGAIDGPHAWIDLEIELWLGIPGQTERSAVQDVRRAIEIGAHAISLRTFALDPQSKLAKDRAGMTPEQLRRHIHRLPDAQDRAAIESAVSLELAAAGFAQYLPGEWALEGHESHYRSLRAAGCDNLGFGLGSCTQFDRMLARDTADLATYLQYSDDPARCIAETRAL